MLKRVALLAVCSVLVTTPAWAADSGNDKTDSSKKDDASKPAEDEFETTWFGVRPELWYQPTMGLQAKVGGLQGNFAGVSVGVPDNTMVDANQDLGVKTHSAKPDYLDVGYGVIGLEAFVDTRWVSVSLWGVPPFDYKGHTVVQNQFSFAGVVFNVSTPVDTDLDQWIGGADIKVNILNNRFIRLSPVLAARSLAIDWTVTSSSVSLGGLGTVSTGFKATTEDINWPIKVGRFQIFPYPEIGAEVRAGYRDYVEADVKLTAMYISYSGIVAKTALFDGGITGYLPFFKEIGLRVGYRYYYFYGRSSSQQSSKQFEGTLRLYGITFSLIARF